MTEPENFLERWSRRKREADESVPTPESKPEKTDAVAPAQTKPPASPPAEAFDVAKLPPIESITAETDMRMFLQEGVPADVTRAALRRAWSSDPAIRDFVGLVENGWDFNDPNAMAGFGPIGSDEVARLLNHMIGTPEEAKAVEPPKAVAEQDIAAQAQASPAASEAPPSPDAPESKDDTGPLQRSKNAASQNDPTLEIGVPTHSIVTDKRIL